MDRKSLIYICAKTAFTFLVENHPNMTYLIHVKINHKQGVGIDVTPSPSVVYGI